MKLATLFKVGLLTTSHPEDNYNLRFINVLEVVLRYFSAFGTMVENGERGISPNLRIRFDRGPLSQVRYIYGERGISPNLRIRFDWGPLFSCP